MTPENITQNDIVNHDKTLASTWRFRASWGMADSFGKRIARARKGAGLTQMELAQIVSVGQSTVAQWEACKNEPSLEMFRRVAQLTNTTPEWLAFGQLVPEESSLLDEFRQLLPERRQFIRDMMSGLIGRQLLPPPNKPSIASSRSDRSRPDSDR